LSNHCSIVLGCTGQDGSLLCKSLLKKNHRVIGVSRTKTSNPLNLKKLNILNEVERTNLNLLDQKEIEKVIDLYSPDTIYNLSAQSSVGKSFDQPKETFASISLSTQNLLESCRKTSFRNSIFFAGSSEMYGSSKKLINLKDHKNPISPYGIAKTNSFELVKLYRDIFKIKCMTGVLFNHESTLRSDQFVFPKIIKSAVQSSKNPNYKVQMGNLNIMRDWGWAEEYIDVIEMIANAEIPSDYLICTGIGYSLTTIAQKTYERFNLRWQDHIQIKQQYFRPTDITKSVGNPIKLYEDHKWKSKININEIITKLINCMHA